MPPRTFEEAIEACVADIANATGVRPSIIPKVGSNADQVFDDVREKIVGAVNTPGLSSEARDSLQEIGERALANLRSDLNEIEGARRINRG